jgi:NADH-quinone oxidoreductase subunit I
MKLERPTLSWAERLYLPAVARGLMLTFRHLFMKKVTRQYPEERPELLGNYRGMPVLVKDQQDRVKCVACQLCEFVCPPKAIRIVPGLRNPTGADAKVEKEPQEFELDLLRCIYCGLCQEACPEEAIFLKRVYAATGYTRKEMLIPKERLLQLGGVHDDAVMKWQNK